MDDPKISDIELEVEELLSQHAYNEESMQSIKNLTDSIKSSIATDEVLGTAVDHVVTALDKQTISDEEVKTVLLELKHSIDEFNTKEIQKVEVKNPVEEVSISNLKDVPIADEVSLRKSGWLTQLLKGVTEAVKQTEKDIQAVRLVENDVKHPISVILSDGKKFYTAISQAIVSGGGGIPFKTAAGVLKEALIDDSGRLQIDQVGTSFDHGRKSSIGGTALQITADSVTALQGVEVKAANGNSDNIYIGNSDVTADGSDATSGMELGAGESFLVKVDNANKVYVISDGTAQSVYWLVA